MAEVIIYQAPKAPKTHRKVLLFLGNSLIVFAFLGILFTFGPIIKPEIEYRLRKNVRTVSRGIGFGELLKKEPPTVIVAPDQNFSLVIPKINAWAKIIANVDASNRSEYLQQLKKGVAHAKGTVFPGMKGTIYLFAHSTDSPWNIVRYNAVFYLLREMEPGDQIIVFFTGKRYNYRATEKKVIEPAETGFFNQKEEEQLVLQTCWPPGTTQKALIVIAKPLKAD